MVPARHKFPKRLYWGLILVGATLPLVIIISVALIRGDMKFPWNSSMPYSGFLRFITVVALFNFLPFAVLAAFMKNRLGKPQRMVVSAYYLRMMGIFGAATTLLGTSLIMHVSIWTSRSSTAGLGVFALFVLAFALMPVGYGCGWFIGEMYLRSKKRRLLRRLNFPE